MDLRITPHRIRILFWFLRRIRLYPQLMRELRSFIHRKAHPTLENCPEAEEWCKERHLSIDDAFASLFPNYKYYDVHERHGAVLEEASNLIDLQSFNWGGQGNISLNYNLAQALDAETVLETGVACGWSTLSILLSMNERRKGSLVSVDMPFFGVTNEEDIGCVVPDNLRERWTLLPYADREGIPKALKHLPHLDFCHYDSDKSYEGKSWAFPVLWEALKPKGTLVSDDVSDNLAFKHFCVKLDMTPTIIHTFDTKAEKHIGILVKPE